VYCEGLVCPGSGQHARCWKVASPPRFVESREGWRRTTSCLSFRQEVKKFQSYYYIFYSELFFYFSLTTLHPFSTSRESVLPIWSTAAQQSHLSNPSTRAADLFLLLHGMLFTSIQLHDFPGTLARFLERLEMEGNPNPKGYDGRS